jgi:AcrR family transcriptional regulator
MVARAAAAEATGERIMDAAQALFGELLYDQVSLDWVAERAGVTVRTVVRRFGSKDRLFASVADRMSRQVRSEREAVRVGDPVESVRGAVRNYERWGDQVLHFLAQEWRTAAIAAVVARGRRYHQSWVERTFAPALVRLPGAERRRRLAQLVVATDVYAWKVLRRDLSLEPGEAETLMSRTVRLVVEAPWPAN